MIELILFVIWLIGTGILLDRKLNNLYWLIFTIAMLLVASIIHFNLITCLAWLIVIAVGIVVLDINQIRTKYITNRIFAFAKANAPHLSDTEKLIIQSGTIGWEGQLFSGSPNWQQFAEQPSIQLSAEEQAFLDGPVNELCSMIDDWQIVYELDDLPTHIWQFLKEHKFFAMIIPKQYGGLQFSALAHSEVLAKVVGRSLTVSSTIAVPNSLGPAELLLHYGTETQKSYYLPRLAQGVEIPCFALTGPHAGSDAAAMPDTGIVTHGDFNGKEILGIRLNFAKRYITLAPVATVIGLAFKLYDPEYLLGGDKTDYGITCALIARDTKGITIGPRHRPLNTPFQNGPITGKDVFIPLDWIIGGRAMAGEGWRMLVECLATGRAISLPSSSSGLARVATLASGAYTRIRKQFHNALCEFEGIQEVLARMTGYSYIMEAARCFAASNIDNNTPSAIAAAIVKYHVTELARHVSCDAMDIHGGKGICLGPNNYIAAGYQGVPIAITVEGANILTRSMMIFGQGAMRAHPYLLHEIHSIETDDSAKFDELLLQHGTYLVLNALRSLAFAVTFGKICSCSSKKPELHEYMQQISRYSAALALATDLSLIFLGGQLKRQESLSARLGDILSYLYLASAIIKQSEHKDLTKEELLIIKWSCQYLFHKTEAAIKGTIANFPNIFIKIILRIFILPFGSWQKYPSDYLNKKIATIISTPNTMRTRLGGNAYMHDDGKNLFYQLEYALSRAAAVDAIERKILAFMHQNAITTTIQQQLDAAVDHNIIATAERDTLQDYYQILDNIIAVDVFRGK